MHFKRYFIKREECTDLLLKKEYMLDEHKIKKYSSNNNKPLRIGTVNKGG